VTDNAANEGEGFSVAATLGRAEKRAVIQEITAAGFVLVEQSTVLANAADDHSKPVTDRSLGGMPDRFVLRFRKPLNSSLVTNRRSDDAMEGLYGNTIISFNFCMPWAQR
jgi:hypothetical protein